jgi:hypothetical protein
MKCDSGLAPNPYWGFCTLAVCTPNHQGVRISAGDWVIGTQPRILGGKLVYAMKLAEERLFFDEYFRDQRFQNKKPVLTGDRKCICGDNFYFLGDDNNWRQIPVPYHNSTKEMEKDTNNPYVYIASEYYYFGENAVKISSKFEALIRDREGCKCDHDNALMSGFVSWLQRNHKPGIHGEPKDRQMFETSGKDTERVVCANSGKSKRLPTVMKPRCQKSC